METESNLISSSRSSVATTPASIKTNPFPSTCMLPSQESNSNEPPVKRVKRGFQASVVPKICGMAFEGSPGWLWAGRTVDFSQIWMSSCQVMRLQQEFKTTWYHFADKVQIFGGKIPSVHVWFLSGSLNFVSSCLNDLPSTTPVVIWLFPTMRRHPDVKGTNVQWVTIHHSQVGGVTNISGQFGLINLGPFKVEPDPVTRTLAHIIKHSERPIPCDPDNCDTQLCYRLSDRLSLHRLRQPVLMSTPFSRSGWGKRKLLPGELAHAFELPSFVLWDDHHPNAIVPLQLLRVTMDHTLTVLVVKPAGAHPTLPVRISPEIDVTTRPSDQVFLPGMRKWLPGSWADAPIASKAAKADNAQIDVSPWHRRISLVLPCSSATLETLEGFCLGLWRRRLVRSFREYLIATYGPAWQRRLWTLSGIDHLSGHRRSAGDDFVVADRSLLRCSKTRKLETGRGGGIGGLGEVGNNDVREEAGNDFANVRELGRDVTLGRAVLSQVLSGTWWDWSKGSSLIFWRWNGPDQVRAARDGMSIFVQRPLPRGRQLKPLNLNLEQKTLVADKLESMKLKSYLEPGFVSNALHFFAVPKGDSDIRVVFDGTSSGLNETLWAPNFYLPTAQAAALNVSYSSWMSDMDCGEMFHNFFMDRRVRKCAGLRIDKIMTSEAVPQRRYGAGETRLQGPNYLRWTRLFMGMRPSPYIAVRHYYWAEEFARGDPSLMSNPMAFDRVILNLPGMSAYNPTLPKVLKWNSTAGALAGDVITFVDDVRVTGFSKENCREVHHQFASRLQYLGMQDAPRKYRPPSQLHAGAWTGTIFRISADSITKSVAQEKWDKGRSMVRRLWDALSKHEDRRPVLERKTLEKETGFLNHLAMTFEDMVPYLKGFYLTLNSWRQGRDAEDWKVSDKEWHQILMDRYHNGRISADELDSGRSTLFGKDLMAPSEVTASPRLIDDVEALLTIFDASDVPPQVNLRSKKILTVVYGFGDASGTGLGSTFTCGTGFTYRIGVWGAAEHPESSNWKEFTNVVEALEEEGEIGNLDNAEIFMFTDNSTVESCAEKGSSSSKKLLRLIVRLQALATRLGIKIHIFHVAGTRMIAQGTDGVSRGYLAQGVMAGEPMRVHIPIYLSAVERSTLDLVPWVQSWSDLESELLDPMGWFQTGHDVEGWSVCADGFARPRLVGSGRTFIWSPPPFAADVALAELRKARIKRQRSCHIFVCPRLCTTLWQKQLYKCADFVFELPVGSTVWPASMHEPLLIGVLFPFLSVKPWQLRGTPKMYAVGRELRGVLQTPELDPRDLLRQFWGTCMGLQHLPERVVRRMLFFE